MTSVDYQQPSPQILQGERKQCLWVGAGSQIFRANIYLKVEFAALITLISASVRSRRHPSAAMSEFNAHSKNTGALRSSGDAPYNYSTSRRVEPPHTPNNRRTHPPPPPTPGNIPRDFPKNPPIEICRNYSKYSSWSFDMASREISLEATLEFPQRPLGSQIAIPYEPS